jgi:NAD(P)-dependent dehydrogenase (short-subunit alcohol dehydrogenase family)
LAGELGREGVAVTVVHPTFLRTEVADARPGGPGRRNAGRGDAGAEADTAEVARTTTGAPLDADDVARAIVQLHARHRAGRRVPVRVALGTTARFAEVGHRLAPERAVRAADRLLGPDR